MEKACDQDLTHSLDTLKSLSIKSVPQVVIRDAYGTWHWLNTVTSIHSIQKSTRNSQKLGNKLASQPVDGKTEKSSSKVKILKKEKMFRLRSWLQLHVKKQSYCWRTFVIRKCNIAGYLHILLVNMIMMMKWLCVPTDLPSTNKLVSTTQRTNESFSRSSFTRSI